MSFFFLRKPKAVNPTTIYIGQSIKASPRFIYSTEQKIAPKDWDFKKGMPKKKQGKDGMFMNRIVSAILKYRDHLDTVLLDADMNGQKVTRGHLREKFDVRFKGAKEKKLDISSVIGDFIRIKNKSGTQSITWNNKYGNIKKKMDGFDVQKGKKQYFDNINDDWILEFCGHLRSQAMNENTLKRNVTYLKTVFIWAKGKYHDKQVFVNPVKSFDVDEVYLTKEELDILFNLEGLRPSLERVRDIFLIGCYSGQRFSDYSVFENADVKKDMIIKKAQKTKDESFIYLHSKLRSLLDKYDWKLPIISDQKFRDYIKDVCKKAKFNSTFKKVEFRNGKKVTSYHKKWEMVGTHTARRTFITLSSENGMPDHIIMKITGIRDPKTLQKYKKTSQESVSEHTMRVWE